jgi:hypothetical protein
MVRRLLHEGCEEVQLDMLAKVVFLAVRVLVWAWLLTGPWDGEG